MNILDTFFFMFEADTSGVKKGTDEGEASAKKLKKAIDDVDLSADKLAANFVNMAKNAAGALAGVLALGAIKVLVNDTAAHTAAVAMQARAIDMSATQLSAYQSIIISMGGTADQAVTTLGKLRDGFVEVARFGTVGVSPMTMAFQSLGASAQTMRDAIKDPTIALSAIADNFSKLNHTQQIFLGQKLGLDQGTIMLLAQGRRSFDELIAKQRELHAVTQEQADASMRYTLAQKELGLTFEAVKRSIAQELLPAFTWVVQGLDKMITWLREHKAVAIATFAAIGAVVATLLVPPLITAAGALWAIIAPALLAAAPFIALGLAIGLVADDIEKFVHGQKSVIGVIVETVNTFLDKHPLIGQTARAVSEIVQMSVKLIVDAFRWLGSVIAGELIREWDQFKNFVIKAIDAILEKFPGIPKAFKIASDGWKVGVDAMTQAFEFLSRVIQKVWDLIAKAPTKVLNWIGNGLARLTGGHYDNIDPDAKPRDPQQQQQQAAAVVRAGKSSATGREIASKLMAMGWSPEQAAGIAGNAMRESGGNPNAENSIGMYGLFQWDTKRRANFAKWAGHDIRGSTLDEQLAFFNYEVTKGTEQAAGARIRATQTPEAAALATAKHYERYGDHPAEDAKRVAAAQAIAIGQKQIVAADSAPLAQPGSVSTTTNVGGSRSSQISVGDIHVHDAGSPKATAQAVKDALMHHINNAIDQHDDGIAG